VVTAFSVPLATTTAVTVPRSTFAVRYWGAGPEDSAVIQT